MALSNIIAFKMCILFLIFNVGWAKPPTINKKKSTESKLIVISMDGLMFEQIQPHSMPFVTEMLKNGVHCPKLQPVFPTKTLVNHFSIATGLYGESHGVTANVVYDNENGKLLTYSSELFKFRKDVTPIWTLNELAGKHSAVSMWAAGEFEFRGRNVTYNERFNRTVDWKQRIDRIIPLLKCNEPSVNLVMFYAEHPDFESHSYSPFSVQVLESLKDMDNMVKYLSEQLDKEGLSSVTDIIILSDHGMDTFYFNDESIDDSIIDLNRVVSEDSCDMYGSSPVFQVIAKNGHNQTDVCNKLKKGAQENGHYNVYTDDELYTTNWHIYNPTRFGPCTVVADPGHVFQDQTALLKRYTDYKNLVPGTKYGIHGYDNAAPSMQAVFVANGPRFRSGVEIIFLQNIDLYHLFAKLLNIEALSSDLDIDGIDRHEIWDQMLKI